ncbi:hypothetical protein DYB25_010543 [Aphanomyces astaci]|uniref:BTB domain-containing protein n=1 Tax=Aphanomyces astaci TaxID=112090 RepID=A0A397AA17_APHAT|nr:hypothetical protein DYB25_010543 [Aphanomyces astaci]RHY08045.1 hypothetical protein DYB36_002800 [Aphanomyces astaci]RHY50977.1 hypothetical protein DYB38_006856 [Aphanomyces astaci]RHY52567.1 hypothetical protein DYB34_004481 [Aphanomyces astaci]RHY61476.1 hypothetical protein DYB30_000748 [Aphanomyces astaci]
MRDPWFCHRLQEGVRQVFEQRVLTDVTLCVGSQRIPAHRLVLALHSPYFRAMFTNGMKECHMNEIHIDVTDPQSFDAILQYMYSGRDVTLDGGNMWPLLAACDQLQMEVREYACMHLRVDNCVNIFACCDAFHLREKCAVLRSVAWTYLATYFYAVSNTESFHELPMALVRVILCSSALCVQDEHHIVASLLGWVDFDPANRQVHLRPLLRSCVRLDAVDVLAESWPPLAVRLTHHRIAHWPPMPYQPPRRSKPQVAPRCNTIPLVVALGGLIGRSISRSTEYLDLLSNSWKQFIPMLHRRAHCGAVTAHDRLYVLGGYCTRAPQFPLTTRVTTHLDSVEMLDPSTHQWSLLPPMLHPRSYLGSAYLHGHIYALGGFNGRRHFACVERFDVTSQVWEHVAPMHHSRSGLAVAVVPDRGLIVACGGFDGHEHLQSVEVFDCSTNVWALVAPMHDVRNGGVAVALATGYICVFGGEVAHGSRVASAELYHVASDVWAPSAPLPVEVSGHGAALWQHQFIYCVGGSTDSTSRQVDCVHRFDGVTQEWTTMPTLHLRSPRSGMAMATVEMEPTCRLLHDDMASIA